MRSPFGALAAAVRTPTTEAQPPVPYVSRAYEHGARYYGAYGSGSAEQQMRTMGSVSTLWSVVHHLSNDTSRATWRLYRSAKSGKAEDRVEVTSHAALDLWRRPNQFMPQQEYVEVIQQHLDLTGEAWWVIARNPRATIPLELWPVRPDRMLPVPSVEHFLAGYLYLGPSGEQVPLALDEVIQLRMPNPLDPYRGMGPVQALMSDLDATRYSAEWNRNFFLNSAEPGGIVQVPRHLSDAEFDEMRTRWAEQHRGVANAHRVAILETGQWVDRKITQRDMQFAELRDVSREIIREAYGIPSFVLGLMEDANRASALASEDMYARHLIEPRLERIKQALNSEFLPLFGATGSGLEFDYDPVSPDDQETDAAALTAKSQSAALLVTAGYDPADVLTTVDLPKMAHVGAPAAQAPPPRVIPGAPEPDEQPVDRMLRALADPPRALPSPAPAAPAPHSTARLLFTWNATGQPPERVDQSDLPDLAPVQATFEAALAALLAKWATVLAQWIDALIERIRALLPGGDLGAAQVPDDAVREGADILAEAMIGLAHEAAQQVVHEARDQGVDITVGAVDEDHIRDAARQVADTLAQELSVAGQRAAIRRRPAGQLTPDEADRIAADTRDELTAQQTAEQDKTWLGHSLTQAQHEGRTATMRESEYLAPSVAYYGQEQNDGRTCKYCAEIDGRWLGNTISDALKDYPAGGYIRCLGGPRCRGMVAAVYRPEQVGGTE